MVPQIIITDSSVFFQIQLDHQCLVTSSHLTDMLGDLLYPLDRHTDKENLINLLLCFRVQAWKSNVNVLERSLPVV